MMDRGQSERDRKLVRLFVALIFPDEIKAALGRLIDDLRPRGQGIKWVESHNIHLTLKFIGEISEKKVERIGQAVGEVLDGRAKFEGRIVGCGGFPNLNRPRVLWVGLEGADPAIDIAKQLNHKLIPIGVKSEKKRLSPHLTLGRIKRPTDLSVLTAYMESLNFDAGSVILNRVALVKSTLTPSGPIYENLNVFELE
jgi:2'-5' RNA ligase